MDSISDPAESPSSIDSSSDEARHDGKGEGKEEEVSDGREEGSGNSFLLFELSSVGFWRFELSSRMAFVSAFFRL